MIALAQTPVVHDWYRAPLNSLTPDELNHKTRHGYLFGDVLKIDNEWFDTDGILINSSLLTTQDQAASYNAVSVDRDSSGRTIAKYEYTGGKVIATTFSYNDQGKLL
ncbi:hypothetical protein [Nonlabens xiamenensis]|uniref:hypothetical protein n=1 Tax=Nonlabens xiamenensis TaxID=2341043 RepID=UPI000F6130BE|nr:hypothetical protein [Nonlabens xiamenensis]